MVIVCLTYAKRLGLYVLNMQHLDFSSLLVSFPALEVYFGSHCISSLYKFLAVINLFTI